MILLYRFYKTIRYAYLLLFSLYTKSSAQTFALLFDVVQDMGGVYVKFMQFLCLRLDNIDDDSKLQFVKLYDHVAYEPLNLSEFLEKELGEKQAQLTEIEQVPFAAGSFAQVYKAKLLDGRPVVLKVKRRDQYQKVMFDFFLLEMICRILTILFDFEQIGLLKLLGEFKKTTFQELEYKIEVKHALYFYEQYRNHPQVVIPETFAELSTDNLIVQEYIAGVSLSEVIIWKQQTPYYRDWLVEKYDIELKQMLFIVMLELIRQHLTFDKYYADPHPGNIILLPHNKFAFIDFGILDSTTSDKNEYFSLMKSLSEPVEEMNAVTTSQQFLRLGAQSLYCSLETIQKSLGKTAQTNKVLTELIIQEFADLIAVQKQTLTEVHTTKKEDVTFLVLQIAEAGKKFQIKVPTGFFNVMRSSTMFKSYAQHLEPGYNFSRTVYKKLAKEYENVALPQRKKAQKYSFEEASEVVMTWLSNIAEVDLPLYLQIHSVLNRKEYV